MQNRRDLAKRETRAALTDAAVEILREGGHEAMTADAVAARAGVSRRTLFNYFPTTEAVLAGPSLDFLEVALEEVRHRPPGESMMESVVAALTAADRDLLTRFATVVRLCQGAPSAERIEREGWVHAETEIQGFLRDRMPADAPELQIRVLAAMLVATGRAAILSWVEDLPDSDTPADPLSLRACLIEAFGHLTAGFPVAPAPRHS